MLVTGSMVVCVMTWLSNYMHSLGPSLSTVTTSYRARIGFNMEFANISDSALKKVGIEACNTCNGVNVRVV